MKRIEAQIEADRRFLLQLEIVQQQRQQQDALDAQQQALESMAETMRQGEERKQQREDRIQAYNRCVKQGGERRQCLQVAP